MGSVPATFARRWRTQSGSCSLRGASPPGFNGVSVGRSTTSRFACATGRVRNCSTWSAGGGSGEFEPDFSSARGTPTASRSGRPRWTGSSRSSGRGSSRRWCSVSFAVGRREIQQSPRLPGRSPRRDRPHLAPVSGPWTSIPRLRSDDPLIDRGDHADHGPRSPDSARSYLPSDIAGLLEADDPPPQRRRGQWGNPLRPGIPCLETLDVADQRAGPLGGLLDRAYDSRFDRDRGLASRASTGRGRTSEGRSENGSPNEVDGPHGPSAI